MNKKTAGLIFLGVCAVLAVLLAASHRVKRCCSLTKGIFITTIANAIEEMKEEGEVDAIPNWRTLKAGGSLNEKYPGGAAVQKLLLGKKGPA